MTEMSDVRILMVIPTLGQRLDTLQRTLTSIRQQQGVAVDVVVVTPAAGAELERTVQAHGARVLVAVGHISAAVNAGFAQAQAQHQYLAWIGDDDVLRPDALAQLSAALQSQPHAAAAFGTCDYIDMSGHILFTRRPPPGAPWWLQWVPGLIKQEACLFRRDSLVRAGRLNEALRFTMDLELLLRLRKVGPLVRVDAVTAAFCWHPDSLTIANRERSFAEAQGVQRQWVDAWLRWLIPVAQPIVRRLILTISERVNRRYSTDAGA
jgi:GT2 family glycosyltransferase